MTIKIALLLVVLILAFVAGQLQVLAHSHHQTSVTCKLDAQTESINCIIK